MEKTKIVLDADVLIHFSKGGLLALLPDIFKDYEYIVLKPVYDELGPVKSELEMVRLLKPIQTVDFNPTGEERKEYFKLLKTRGKGESASMAYCKYHHDVIGSSNLKDIKDYCIENGITYLTTIDFLYYAIRKGLIAVGEAERFVSEVKSKGSKLPSVVNNHNSVCTERPCKIPLLQILLFLRLWRQQRTIMRRSCRTTSLPAKAVA